MTIKSIFPQKHRNEGKDEGIGKVSTGINLFSEYMKDGEGYHLGASLPLPQSFSVTPRTNVELTFNLK